MSQNRYQILGTIGTGSTSRVDKARDTLIDRTVVLKTFATGFGSPELQKEFLREAQILGRLSHPNIISIYDLGVNDDGSAYLVTEYVPGQTLDAVMTEKGPIPLARAGVWAGDLASALARAHKAGVIHGDVKPANIFVTEEGQIKLGDFGIARYATQVSGSASLVGTPAYLSPEQIKGETQDHRSDIFSIGIVLYQLTTGVRPFDGSSVAAVCAQIVARQPPPPSRYNPSLPVEFDRIVMRCLAKDPAGRYATGESLAASLYPFARSKPEPVPHRINFSLLQSWFTRPLSPSDKWIYGGAVAAALLLIPFGQNFYRTPHRVEKPPSSIVADAAPSVLPQNLPVLPPPPARNQAAPRSSAPAKPQRPAPIETAKSPVSANPGANSPGTFAGRTASNVVPAANSSTTSAPPASGSTPQPLRSASAPVHAAKPASLSVEISSAIDGATLALFVDRQLVATSPLSITRPGESLHLDRPLLAGAHEFRVALYRQDKTLQTEKQGLAELQPGSPNLLAIRVIRRSKMLVKHNADLDILWPSASPDSHSAKPSNPLLASSAPSR